MQQLVYGKMLGKYIWQHRTLLPLWTFLLFVLSTSIDGLVDVTEAEKVAFVAKIQWDQKIMEKESEKKMAEIEGRISILYI